MCIKRFLFLTISLIFMTAASSLYEKNWHDVKAPTKAVQQVYGGYSAGCIDGASHIDKEGIGYMSVSNGSRIYGHESLVNIITKLGGFAHDKYNKILLVGDLAHPRGGPTSLKTSAHRSHQNGLDADIWYNLIKKGQKPDEISVLQKNGKAIDPKHWTDEDSELLKEAASFDDVERILVNPYVKRAMCEKYNNANWLKKLRPWWGHSKHFHLRLKCPDDSKSCEKQESVPDDSGCGSELDWWFSQEAANKGKEKEEEKRVYPNLPAQCEEVFDADW